MLDVGCGTGYFTRLLSSGDEGVKATGIDLEEDFIKYAPKEAKERGLSIDFMVGDALFLSFEDNTFDAVTSHTFFTSIHDPKKAMAEMIRVTKPGGMISSVTPMSLAPIHLPDQMAPELDRLTHNVLESLKAPEKYIEKWQDISFIKRNENNKKAKKLSDLLGIQIPDETMVCLKRRHCDHRTLTDYVISKKNEDRE